jgi:hypothetical protein
MFWEVEKEYQKKRKLLPRETAIFSGMGWRPLLKVAVSRTEDWWKKRNAIKLFHEEYAYLSMK